MIIKVYKSNSDPRVMDKQLTFIRQYEIVYKDNLDVLDTSILLKTSEIDFNYIEFVASKRYYFVTNTEIESKDRTRVYLHCDVLSTYKSEIYNSYGLVIERVNATPYFSKHDILETTNISEITLATPFLDTPINILTTIYGG